MLRKLPEVQREFIRTQHLHVVASSIAKPPVDAFVSVVTRSMVNLVCFFLVSAYRRCVDILITGISVDLQFQAAIFSRKSF